MNKSSIEWTQYTLNPFVGCSKCSPGCENCYAEKFASRLAKNPNPKISYKYKDVVDDKVNWTSKISPLDLSCFDKLPKRPSRVFVGSMTDIFHENMPYNRLDAIFSKIADYPQHTFMILTKRPHIAHEYFPHIPVDKWLTEYNIFYTTEIPFPLSNVWLGVTVCNQAEADGKIPILLQIPAAKHFVSIEPMLSAVDIKQYLQGDNKLTWVIAGGETGTNARPMHEAWVKSLRDQCLETGTPYFFKSWGEWCSYEQAPDYLDSDLFLNNLPIKYLDGKKVFKIGKKQSGHLIDGVEYRQFLG